MKTGPAPLARFAARSVLFLTALTVSAWAQTTSQENPEPYNNPPSADHPPIKAKERSPGGEIGSGAGNIGMGAAKGAGHLAKGTGKGAVNLVTLHPIDAATSVGTGAVEAGKDVGVGTVKGTAKIGKGIGKGIKKIF
jgi:hypothetical protein